jgi:hypothetical protein
MPEIDILRYDCPVDAKFVNLPGTIVKPLVIYNCGYAIRVTPCQYNTYITLDPRFLYKHKYLYYGKSGIKIYYLLYCSDHYDSPAIKHRFYIAKKTMHIVDQKIDDETIVSCCFTANVVQKMIGFYDRVVYSPTSLDNFLEDVKNIKAIIEPLKLEIKCCI